MKTKRVLGSTARGGSFVLLAVALSGYGPGGCGIDVPDRPCADLAEAACKADSRCQPEYAQPLCACAPCPPDVVCPPCSCGQASFTVCSEKRPTQVGACEELGERQCLARADCQAFYGGVIRPQPRPEPAYDAGFAWPAMDAGCAWPVADAGWSKDADAGYPRPYWPGDVDAGSGWWLPTDAGGPNWPSFDGGSDWPTADGGSDWPIGSDGGCVGPIPPPVPPVPPLQETAFLGCGPRACPAIQCAAGCTLERDAAGCDRCSCEPPPVCPAVMCDMYCPFGFARDERGCERCACELPPPPPPPCEAPVRCAPECGVKFDAAGCAVCECPLPVCPAVMCDLDCPAGLAFDEKGCERCACAEPPPPPACDPVRCAPGCAVVFDGAGCATCECAQPECPEGADCISGCAAISDESLCRATPGCRALYGASWCGADGTCTADRVFKGCE